MTALKRAYEFVVGYYDATIDAIRAHPKWTFWIAAAAIAGAAVWL
jgi:hypothetical protein